MNKSLDRYFEVLTQLDHPLGSWKDGEIEIITDIDLIRQAEKKIGATVGVIDEDRYVIHIRDAVFLPPKVGTTEPILGTYIRFVYTYELQKNLGVFVLPIHTDGRIVLNLTFRHALRRWVIEGCGTIAQSGESQMDTIKRCVDQELGCELIDHRKITDYFVPERGLIGGLVPIYAAKVDFQSTVVYDPTVQGHVLLTAEQYLEYVQRGEVELNGRKYICCDGYTIAAVTIAREKGWL